MPFKRSLKPHHFVIPRLLESAYLKGLCHRYWYINGSYGNVYDKAPMLSISIQVVQTKNMHLYCGQQRGTSDPVSCDIAPLKKKSTQQTEDI